MNTQTFEEAVTAAQAEPLEMAAIRQTLNGPIQELIALKTRWAKQHPKYCGRSSHIRHRAEQAMRAGVPPDAVLYRLNPWLRDLEGGPGIAGLLHSVGPHIDAGLSAMERFSVKDLPHWDRWRSWPQIPARITDSIRAIEDRLSWLEEIVKDGGSLQQMVEQVAEQKAGNHAGA